MNAKGTPWLKHHLLLLLGLRSRAKHHPNSPCLIPPLHHPLLPQELINTLQSPPPHPRPPPQVPPARRGASCAASSPWSVPRCATAPTDPGASRRASGMNTGCTAMGEGCCARGLPPPLTPSGAGCPRFKWWMRYSWRRMGAGWWSLRGWERGVNAEVGKFIISLQYIIINTKMIVLCHPEIIMVTPHIQSLQSQRVNAFDIMMNLVNMGMCVLLCSQWQDHGRGWGSRPPLLKISVPQSESTYMCPWEKTGDLPSVIYNCRQDMYHIIHIFWSNEDLNTYTYI